MFCSNNIYNNSFLSKVTLPFVGLVAVAAISGIALAIIGLTASSGGAFRSIVQLGVTTNGTLLGVSTLLLMVTLGAIIFTCKKRHNHVPTQEIPPQNVDPRVFDNLSPYALSTRPDGLIPALINPIPRPADAGLDAGNLEIEPAPSPIRTNFEAGAILTLCSGIENKQNIPIPHDSAREIFSFLDYDTLMTCREVNKNWRLLAKEMIPKVRPKVHFSPLDHRLYLGINNIRNIPPFPVGIGGILQSQCPFWPDKTVAETHRLILIPGNYNIENCAFTWGQKCKDGIPFFCYLKNDSVNKFVAQESYWILVTKDFVSKDYVQYLPQEEPIGDFVPKLENQSIASQYFLLSLLEATICVVGGLIKSSDQPLVGEVDHQFICKGRQKEMDDSTAPIVGVGHFSNPTSRELPKYLVIGALGHSRVMTTPHFGIAFARIFTPEFEEKAKTRRLF